MRSGRASPGAAPPPTSPRAWARSWPTTSAARRWPDGRIAGPSHRSRESLAGAVSVFRGRERVLQRARARDGGAAAPRAARRPVPPLWPIGPRQVVADPGRPLPAVARRSVLPGLRAPRLRFFALYPRAALARARRGARAPVDRCAQARRRRGTVDLFQRRRARVLGYAEPRARARHRARPARGEFQLGNAER